MRPTCHVCGKEMVPLGSCSKMLTLHERQTGNADPEDNCRDWTLTGFRCDSCDRATGCI